MAPPVEDVTPTAEAPVEDAPVEDAPVEQAPIDEAPFYAMRIEAGDFGTLGGLDTDTHARVKCEAGGVFDGLFAVGNSSAAILPTYPGPGATLGPAMTMAYQSAKYINQHAG